MTVSSSELEYAKNEIKNYKDKLMESENLTSELSQKILNITKSNDDLENMIRIKGEKIMKQKRKYKSKNEELLKRYQEELKTKKENAKNYINELNKLSNEINLRDYWYNEEWKNLTTIIGEQKKINSKLEIENKLLTKEINDQSENFQLQISKIEQNSTNDNLLHSEEVKKFLSEIEEKNSQIEELEGRLSESQAFSIDNFKILENSLREKCQREQNETNIKSEEKINDLQNAKDILEGKNATLSQKLNESQTKLKYAENYINEIMKEKSELFYEFEKFKNESKNFSTNEISPLLKNNNLNLNQNKNKLLEIESNKNEDYNLSYKLTTDQSQKGAQNSLSIKNNKNQAASFADNSSLNQNYSNNKNPSQIYTSQSPANMAQSNQNIKSNFKQKLINASPQTMI